MGPRIASAACSYPTRGSRRVLINGVTELSRKSQASNVLQNALFCCNKLEAPELPDKQRRGRPRKQGRPSKRATVSLRPETYETLDALAKQKKVSVAWVIRDAAEKYVADQWPLFGRAP